MDNSPVALFLNLSEVMWPTDGQISLNTNTDNHVDAGTDADSEAIKYWVVEDGLKFALVNQNPLIEIF